MGRHSRRGPAPKDDPADIAARRGGRGSASGTPREARQPTLPGQRQAPEGAPASRGYGAPRTAQGTPGVPPGTPAGGVPRFPDGTPAHGVPRFPDGTPAQGVPRLPDGTPAHGVPRLPDGTPTHGVPRLPDGTPAHGVPRLPDGTAAQGVPRFPGGPGAQGGRRAPEGTPAQGTPRLPDGTPAHGVPRFGGGAQARAGHPEQREVGGGWGEFAGAAGAGAGGAPGVQQGPAGPGVAFPRQRQRQRQDGGPRQDYLEAFEEGVDVFAPRSGRTEPAEAQESYDTGAEPAAAGGGAVPTGVPAQRGGGKGRAFTGIAAAAVTTVLAVVVAGQVTDHRDDADVRSQSATDQARGQVPGQSAPSAAPSVATLTYEQKMDRTYPLSATLKGSGKFDAVPGFDKAPGKGQKYTYRVDVEQGLGLDGELFAAAVQKTLNDNRSWAHGGARTFERVYSGKPDFVITLASPGTTAKWCAKSGLDTTEDNVSCDSASTERVMINAYRWAQGSKTYGDKIHAYRQMLINHEVGHRLGHGHVTCQKDGELAPVMQQQTKFLDHDGIHCLPNPWPYPRS
ncbi:DUF3152 domain-containing protein [Streptomyces diastatochromogenes]|uniref:DUF3152 domain-containing protein n=1 Tax=Streptomyces diastatochromogenes TaxID=42236 RepID=UPI00365B27BA